MSTLTLGIIKPDAVRAGNRTDHLAHFGRWVQDPHVIVINQAGKMAVLTEAGIRVGEPPADIRAANIDVLKTGTAV
jgi:hypothetical protein